MLCPTPCVGRPSIRRNTSPTCNAKPVSVSFDNIFPEWVWNAVPERNQCVATFYWQAQSSWTTTNLKIATHCSRASGEEPLHSVQIWVWIPFKNNADAGIRPTAVGSFECSCIVPKNSQGFQRLFLFFRDDYRWYVYQSNLTVKGACIFGLLIPEEKYLLPPQKIVIPTSIKSILIIPTYLGCTFWTVPRSPCKNCSHWNCRTEQLSGQKEHRMEWTAHGMIAKYILLHLTYTANLCPPNICIKSIRNRWMDLIPKIKVYLLDA